MQEEKSERKTDIDGNVENGAIVSGDNNNVFNLVYNFIYKQTDTKLSAGFVHLITVGSIAAIAVLITLIFLSIVLFVYFPAEAKAKMTFPQFIITFVAVSAVCICFIFALLKVYQNIKILIIILIPLCMAFSIASAAYILDENIFHIIERIVFSSNKKKLDNINSPHISGIKEAHDDRKFDHPKPANSGDRDALTQKSPDRNMDEKTVTASKPTEEKDIPPIARDDGFSVSKNNPKKLNILANDVGDKLT